MTSRRRRRLRNSSGGTTDVRSMRKFAKAMVKWAVVCILVSLYSDGATSIAISSRGGSAPSPRTKRRGLSESPKPTQPFPASHGHTRHACNFFVWDMFSALLYRWNNYLLRDCVYEGIGGRKVRQSSAIGELQSTK